MNIYYVKRTDTWSWDEYDSCVIIAGSEQGVEEVIASKKDCWDDNSYQDNGLHTIVKIGVASDSETARVVCSSFHAG